jgi:hypothetical protein
MLDDIDRALERSTIYDRAIRHDLIFGHGNATFTLIQRIKWKITSGFTGIQPALTYNEAAIPYFSHIITFRIPDVERNVLLDPDTGAEIDLRRTLAHEVVHSLLQAEIGPDVVRYPMWKQEGYAEYVAAFTGIVSDSRYEFWNSVKKIREHDFSWLRDGSGQYAPMRYGCQRQASIANEDGRPWPACYYISRVLMEYLFGIKGMDFAQVMRPNITDVDTLTELLTVYESRQASEVQ